MYAYVAYIFLRISFFVRSLNEMNIVEVKITYHSLFCFLYSNLVVRCFTYITNNTKYLVFTVMIVISATSTPKSTEAAYRRSM